MRFFRRALVGLFLMAVTVAILALAGNSVWTAMQDRMAQETRTPPVRERVFSAEVTTIALGRETPVLTAFGEVRSRRTLELRAPAEGTVIELAENFEDGGAVEAGQLLLRIDPAEAQSARDTAAADLRDAENELAEATRALDLAREDVAAAQRQAELRARAFERQQDLLSRGVGSAVAVEEAELAAATADQAVLSRRQALATAEARVANAETALERRRIALADAERVLAQTELRAEFSGVLSDVAVVAGRLVSRNEQLASLIDPDALEVSFRISTAQYANLISETGDLPNVPVRVILDVFGLDLSAEARLTRESGAVEEGQSGRLLFARIEEPRGLRVGDFVRVEVAEPPLAQVARLPATAYGSDGQILVLDDENRLEAVEVRLLRRQGDDVLVSLPPAYEGRQVVAARTPVLGEGIRINPVAPAGDEADAAAPEPETIALDPERRARLIAFVEANSFIPADVRERMLNQLNQDEVPARMVARLEERMGS
ncbi:HlyD family efflux transporter periplasmic adaptor subunit [Roseibacterium beibuensis]|uniref:Efflux RND transporter periplasmic adaptor subunit n=1 Tax=[Roseibacterium] beibuensis TaxID=1193142 RepID=A0ABP9LJY0_9RHOB|nr:HlyD family efflux transporter periplasmic adaptor subunit [Roseibacterium beibuensis]MCS6623403.1 HlyD family efflux transporter periplasmic adaptor subunit [Roseibacterium beibuensis]